MWHRGHEILFAISCSMARCLHEPHTQNCGSSMGRPDTMHGANLVSQLGQFVLHSVICVPHWGQSPLNAGFLSFGEFLFLIWKKKIKTKPTNLIQMKWNYNEKIWNAKASNSLRSFSSIASFDSNLINALEAALYEPFPHAHRALKFKNQNYFKNIF